MIRAGFAARLGDEFDVADRHAAVNALAHVINRQARGGHAGQGFHLDAGFAITSTGHGDFDFGGGLGFNLHVNARQHDRVAQRNEVRRRFVA